MATLTGSLFCFSETLLNLWKQNTKQMKQTTLALIAFTFGVIACTLWLVGGYAFEAILCNILQWIFIYIIYFRSKPTK